MPAPVITPVVTGTAPNQTIDLGNYTSQVNAGVSRAWASGQLQPDVATGRAAVSDGDEFQVLVGDEYVRYRRDSSTTQTEVGRYPSAQQVSQISGRVYYEPAPADLEVSVDQNENIYRRTAADGSMFLPDLDASVQEKINSQKDSYAWGDFGVDPGDLLNIADAEGKVVVRVTAAGDLLARGRSGGGSAGDTGVTVASGRTHFNSLSARANGLLARLSNAGISPIAPCPDTMLPGDFSISSGIVNAYSAAQPAQRLVIDSPYFDDDEFVHPHIIEFPNGFRGYRYWLAINPYAGGSAVYENPFIYGTNDFQVFDLIPDMPQPLALFGPSPNYNADVAFFYNPLTGELGVMWIHVINNADVEVRARTTRDGIDWSDTAVIFPQTSVAVDRNITPSLLYNPADGYWYLYTQQLTPAFPATNVAREIRVRRSRNFNGPWSSFSVIATTPESAPWHMEFRCVGDKVVGLLANTHSGNLFLAVSTTDWMTFNTGSTPILTGNEACYKGSFLPVFNDQNEMALRLIWTSARGHPSGVSRWNVYTALSNFTPISGE